MGEACGTYERDERRKLWWGILRETDHLEDSDVDGKIIIRWIFGK